MLYTCEAVSCSCVAAALARAGSSSGNNTVELTLELKTKIKSSLNPRFLSVTVDGSLASEPKYIAFLRSQKLIALAKGLSPAYLRFGGTKSDFLLFDPSKNEYQEDRPTNQAANICEQRTLTSAEEKMLHSQWFAQEQQILKENFRNQYTNATITKSTVDMLYRFANCSDLHLIFGLNVLLRNDNNEWNTSNAKLLIDYCSSNKYNLSWELGNEPNSFRKKSGIYISGSQLGKDFVSLHKLLRKYPCYQNSGLFGPDIGQPKTQSQKMLKSFLETGGEIINSITWHHYYVSGPTASEEDFINPDILDSLVSEIQTVFQIVNESVPGKRIWLGETSSAYGGGAPGLSNTYLDGFMWLDKLGISAKSGIDVVMRQALFGAGSYNLVDSDFEPLPDYWLCLLFKKLVGSIVLNAGLKGTSRDDRKLRVYIHCTNKNNPKYAMGDVTLFVLNLHDTTKNIQLPSSLSGKFIDEYLLLPAGKEGLQSATPTVNMTLHCVIQ
ncbi:heparanase isoform X2 [Xenopus laevis]|uniref:Heparanase n=1 Tax=Xenopus laevis TaxID=8355 RepID=A0A8J1N051_XENLA|nr:heparanase isoform X2 [Xenopus laevis]